MFDMSLTYILVALVAVLLNNALVERLSLHTRITAGTHRRPPPQVLVPTCPAPPSPPSCLCFPLRTCETEYVGFAE